MCVVNGYVKSQNANTTSCIGYDRPLYYVLVFHNVIQVATGLHKHQAIEGADRVQKPIAEKVHAMIG